MPYDAAVLATQVRTVSEMAEAFRDEDECRRIMEAMVWRDGRVCPFCGSLRSHALAGRDQGCRARPGLYQCAARECRGQFTVTTRTPLHATKLKLSTWLKAMWLMLQTDKGMSSPRLAELVGVTQTTAWRMGHALRLMMAGQAKPLSGVVEADEMLAGGRPRRDPADPDARRNRQGHTFKRPVMVAVERPGALSPGDPPGRAAATPASGLSARAVTDSLSTVVSATSHLMSDGHGAFAVAGRGFAEHDSVNHSEWEYVRGQVHVNSAEGFNDRIRRTVTGVYHHVSQAHLDRYLHEVAFRWNQRVFVGLANRRTRSGRVVSRRLYDKRPPSHQMCDLLRRFVGIQFRRTENGSLRVLSGQAVFRM